MGRSRTRAPGAPKRFRDRTGGLGHLIECENLGVASGRLYGAAVSVLRVERALDSAGIFRRIVIDIDGAPAVRVGHGKTVEVAVSPGEHTLRARMDWHTSPTIEVNVPAGETVTVRVNYPFSAVRKLFRRSDSAIAIARR